MSACTGNGRRRRNPFLHRSHTSRCSPVGSRSPRSPLGARSVPPSACWSIRQILLPLRYKIPLQQSLSGSIVGEEAQNGYIVRASSGCSGEESVLLSSLRRLPRRNDLKSESEAVSADM